MNAVTSLIILDVYTRWGKLKLLYDQCVLVT